MPVSMTQNETLLELTRNLDDLKNRQKNLSEKEAAVKDKILEVMNELGEEKVDTPYGSISVRKRVEKDYGDDVRKLENEVKKTKKMLNDMGQFEIVSVKESVFFLPLKAF
jgi:hypothetical protein